MWKSILAALSSKSSPNSSGLTSSPTSTSSLSELEKENSDARQKARETIMQEVSAALTEARKPQKYKKIPANSIHPEQPEARKIWIKFSCPTGSKEAQNHFLTRVSFSRS